jgi:predicted MFS family arabinose efflux permease
MSINPGGGRPELTAIRRAYNGHFLLLSLPSQKNTKVSSESRAAVSQATVTAVVAATTVAQVASVMGVAVFPVIAPRLASDVGVEAALIGYQMSLIYGTAMANAPFMSTMVPRWGACRASQMGLAFCVLAMALAMTASVSLLAAASVLLGLATSVMTPASAHLLIRFSPPQRRNLIFSIKQTGVPLGWTLVALAAPAITLTFGWRWSLMTVLATALAVLLLLQRVRAAWDNDRRPHTGGPRRSFEGLVVLWRYPVLRWLAMASLFLSFVQLCVGTFAVTMLVEEAGYGLVTAGFVLSLTQAAGVAGRILWGWIADRMADSLGMLEKLSMTMIACCLATAFLSPAWPVPLTVLLFAIFGASAVGWNGLFLAEVARRSPRGLVSIATGGAMVWNFGGILIGPALFATAYKLIGSYTATYGALALVAAAGLGLLLLSAGAARREAASATP